MTTLPQVSMMVIGMLKSGVNELGNQNRGNRKLRRTEKINNEG